MFHLKWSDEDCRQKRARMDYADYFGPGKRMTKDHYYEYYNVVIPEKLKSFKRKIADFTGSFYLKDQYSDDKIHLFLVGPADSPYCGYLLQATICPLHMINADPSITRLHMRIPPGTHTETPNQALRPIGFLGGYFLRNHYNVALRRNNDNRDTRRDRPTQSYTAILTNIERCFSAPNFSDPYYVGRANPPMNRVFNSTDASLHREFFSSIRTFVKNNLVCLYHVNEDVLVDMHFCWAQDKRGFDSLLDYFPEEF